MAEHTHTHTHIIFRHYSKFGTRKVSTYFSISSQCHRAGTRAGISAPGTMTFEVTVNDEVTKGFNDRKIKKYSTQKKMKESSV